MYRNSSGIEAIHGPFPLTPAIYGRESIPSNRRPACTSCATGLRIDAHAGVLFSV